MIAFHGSKLDEGSLIQDASFPAKIKVVAFLENCRPVGLKGAPPANARGLAKRFELEELPSHKEYPMNTAGIVFTNNFVDL